MIGQPRLAISSGSKIGPYEILSLLGAGGMGVKAVGQGTKPLRITDDPAIEGSPAWSPHGRQIAFARWADNTAFLHLSLTVSPDENLR
jgi:hypothetical protein